MFAFDGMMNFSRKPANGSAASREAAYSLLDALAGNSGLDSVPLVDMMEEDVAPVLLRSQQNEFDCDKLSDTQSLLYTWLR